MKLKDFIKNFPKVEEQIRWGDTTVYYEIKGYNQALQEIGEMEVPKLDKQDLYDLILAMQEEVEKREKKPTHILASDRQRLVQSIIDNQAELYEE